MTTHKNTNTERLSLALTVVKEVQSKNVTSDKTLTDFPSSGKRRGVEPGRVYFFDKIGHVKFHVNICDTNFASFTPVDTVHRIIVQYEPHLRHETTLLTLRTNASVHTLVYG